MALRANGLMLRVAAAVLAAAAVAGGPVWLVQQSTAAQTTAYRAPRTPDGKPNLNGIWQALNTANWDLLDHSARSGAVVAMGAVGAVPGGLGVVEGNEIPYKPEAAARKTCCAFHHGGKATATTSAPGRTCKDRAAIAMKLEISNAAAFSHAGHRGVVMLFACSIPVEYRDEAKNA